MIIDAIVPTFIADQELLSAEITRQNFLQMVQKYYCPIVTKNSRCGKVTTGTCLGCRKGLQAALITVGKVRNPAL